MKYIWEKKDIQAGLYAIRDSAEVTNRAVDLADAVTKTIKIGFGYFEKTSIQNYTRTDVLTDGMTLPLGPDDIDVVEFLNKGNYRPLRKTEFIELIEATDQGFFQF